MRESLINQLNIDFPTWVIHEPTVRKNINDMVKKTTSLGITFRPHFKTHQSSTIARWFAEAGVHKATVSSVRMAAYFESNGWDDLTIAFPLNRREIDTINDLASKIKLTLLIEDEETLDFLSNSIKFPVNYQIKTDVGYGRTGVHFNDHILLRKLQSSKNPKVTFAGLLTHAGHTYKATNEENIEQIHRSSVLNFHSAAKAFPTKPILSYGDTPSISKSLHFPEIDELRCGNFVYYDLTQAFRIKSCSVWQIAGAVVCPVVAIHKLKRQVIIYGGAVHFSKDSLTMDDGKTIYGIGAKLSIDGWILDPDLQITSISQEHGIVSVFSNIENILLGDLLAFFPVHSCLAADLLSYQITTNGHPIDKMNHT